MQKITQDIYMKYNELLSKRQHELALAYARGDIKLFTSVCVTSLVTDEEIKTDLNTRPVPVSSIELKSFDYFGWTCGSFRMPDNSIEICAYRIREPDNYFTLKALAVQLPSCEMQFYKDNGVLLDVNNRVCCQFTGIDILFQELVLKYGREFSAKELSDCNDILEAICEQMGGHE